MTARFFHPSRLAIASIACTTFIVAVLPLAVAFAQSPSAANVTTFPFPPGTPIGAATPAAVAPQATETPVAAATPAAAAVSPETEKRLFGTDGNEPDSSAATAPDATKFGIGDFLNLALRLGAVAGAIYGAVWLLRRWMQRRGSLLSASGRIRVLETIAITSGRLLYVVDVGDRVLLLGATPQQLSLLTELTDPETIHTFRDTGGRSAQTAMAGRLQGLLSRINMPSTLRNSGDDQSKAPGPAQLLGGLRSLVERRLAASRPAATQASIPPRLQELLERHATTAGVRTAPSEPAPVYANGPFLAMRASQAKERKPQLLARAQSLIERSVATKKRQPNTESNAPEFTERLQALLQKHAAVAEAIETPEPARADRDEMIARLRRRHEELQRNNAAILAQRDLDEEREAV